MASQFKSLDLDDRFTLFKKGILTNRDMQVLISLYQPLIGATAFALLMTLWDTVEEVHQPLPHTILITDLNIDINVFYQSRIKLEAVGLQKTYQRQNHDSAHRELIYELIPPVAPADFFKDDILALALYEAVGEQRFQHLASLFVYPRLSLSDDVKEVTKSFYDVFYTSLQQIPSVVQDAKHNVNQRQKAQQPHFSQTEMQTFNWAYFKQIVGRNNISSAEVDQHQVELFNLATFYELNETQLARLTAMTMNVNNGSIDMASLQRVVSHSYEHKSNQHHPQTLSAAPAITVSQALLQQVGFNETELSFLMNNLSLAPRSFLEQYRQLHNNFVSQTDIQTLSKLVTRHVLRDDIINILVAYVLRDHRNLTSSVVDTVANEWLQQKITEPDQALMQIIKYQQTQRSHNYHPKRRIRTEKIPAWMQRDYQQKQLSTQEAAALAQKNQKLLHELGLQKDDQDDEHE